MSDSDSEGFESAGEELDDLQDEFHGAMSKPLSADIPSTSKVQGNHNLETKSDSKIPAEKKGVDDKVHSQKEKTERKQKPEGDEDGWDFEDWGDESSNSATPIKSKANSPQKSINSKNDEGWEDFDDWEEEPPEKSKQNISNTFPILDQISSKEASNNSSQTNKSVSLPTKVGSKSTYDALPVLNDLSQTKLDVSLPPNEEEKSKIDRENVQDSENASASAWGWKPWGGVVSLLSTATEGVTSLTSHVSQGLSTVIENSMGVPDPEELARINKEKMKIVKETEDNAEESDLKQEETLLPSLGNIVSGFTTIGNKVITGGLDTLEGIGKKTMTILQENDPLLLNKRRLLGLETDKPVLSQVLREAKEKSEEIEKNLKQIQKKSYKKQLHFESLFDHYYGLVHLEALEMLSKQSSIKLQSLLEPLSGKALAELQETLIEVKELCDLGDIENEDSDGIYTSDDLSNRLDVAVEDLGIKTDFKDILTCWSTNIEWLTENPKAEAQEAYEKGLRCLAETCALAIHKYHKIAEMLLIKDHHSTANETDSLVQLTTIFCSHLKGVANRFGGKLNDFEQNEEINSMITSIFVEVYNSTSYVQNAFQLFIPILQIGAA